MQATLPTEIHNAYKKILSIQDKSVSGVVGAIQAAATRTGVDFAYLLNKADQESGLNPAAKAATSSATGLYQFIKQTWLQMVKQHGNEYGLGAEAQAIEIQDGKAVVKDKELREKILNLRHDPALSAAMAAEFTRDNKDYLESSVGGNVGSTELYFAHFLGAGGASKFLKAMRASPDAAAAELMPEAAEANPSVFYNKSGRELSLREIYDRFASKFADKGLTRFAGLDARAAAPVIEANASTPSILRRDMANYSADYYAPPDSDLSLWQQKGTTSGTLFNVMVMAQNSMNESLGSFVRNEKDEKRVS
jgi:hypothetical protein